MNDNNATLAEGPRHQEALALLEDLKLILANADRSGFERMDGQGDRVFDFAYWASECQRVTSL